MEIERRFNSGRVEVRGTFAGKQVRLGGYAAKFNARSENMGGAGIDFYEIIEPGFFDNVLRDDVRCLKNHDENLILGRTASGTCRIAQDDTGLVYECDADEGQTYARDLIISLERGDITQSSFAFTVKREGVRWVEQGNVITRYLLKGGCTRLYDVSPVVYPAYPDATVALREAEIALGRRLISRSPDHAARERELQLAEMEE